MRLFRSESASPRPVMPLAMNDERVARHSSALGEFARHIADREALCILDLGPTSPQNIEYLTGLGHKLYTEDVLRASFDPTFRVSNDEGQPAISSELYLADNLNYPEEKFDAALCWDIPDYMPESLVKPMVDRIRHILKPGGVVLAFFHTRDAGPDAPYYRYHIIGKDNMELQSTRRFRLQRVFNNRQTENLFKEFSSLKFFLARDHIREMLVIR